MYGLDVSFEYNSYMFVEDGFSVNYRGKPGYSGGLVIGYRVSEKIILTSGVQYSAKNFKEEIKILAVHPDDPFLSGEVAPTIHFSSKYVEVPVGINYRFNTNNSSGLMASLAFVNAWQVGNSRKIEPGGGIYLGGSLYNDYLAGLRLGVGFLWQTGHMGIHVEPNTKFYLNKVHRAGPEDNTVNFGLSVRLLKY